MTISNTGQSMLYTPYCRILLNKVLHVPRTKKNLIYVHRLTSDNHVYLEYHPHYFLVTDQMSKKILLHGRCKNGLYPWPSLEQSSSSKCAFMTTRPSSIRWHDRLGHPSMSIISRLVSEGKLVCSQELNKDHLVCDACQQGKSHQLPFPKSSSVSQAPLKFIFLDVWGPAPTSVGRNNYYVSFIDDHSKFTWIYLIRHKSKVFKSFICSKVLLNECSIRKSLLFKQIGEASITS
jgi:hypothetical protein